MIFHHPGLQQGWVLGVGGPLALRVVSRQGFIVHAIGLQAAADLGPPGSQRNVIAPSFDDLCRRLLIACAAREIEGVRGLKIQGAADGVRLRRARAAATVGVNCEGPRSS